MNIYEGAFEDTLTTPEPENANIQKMFRVRLYDTETAVDNPYNVRFRVTDNGDGTLTATITSDLFDPALFISAAFGYFNGSWIDQPMNLTGQTVLTVPAGDWLYSFVVTTDLGDTRRLFTQGATTALEMAETPLAISVIDNDEDKFKVIKSKQVEIQIHSSNAVDVSLFVDGGDNRFYVEVESQVEGVIFQGFLSVGDLRQEFLPDPNIIVLTATDGLGYLQDEPLVNFDGVTPSGEQEIIKFLVYALAKTGLNLDVKVCMNIRENTAVPIVSDTDGAGHFYKFIYLNAKTFEGDTVGVCEDSFRVLEKILGENCRILQYKGDWLILRIDELETGHEYYFTRFDYLGNFVENTVETFTKDIGVNLPLSFMNDDAEVSFERPYRLIREKFDYNYPKEIVCNIDFSRGVEVITPPDLTAPTSTGTYQTDCWFIRNIEVPITSTTFIEKNFEFGYEKSRYMVITPKATTATPWDFAQSSPIPIQQGDKIDFSVDWRFRNNIPGASGAAYHPCMIWILADNGDRYYWYNAVTPLDITTFQWVFRAAVDGEANFDMPSTVPADFDYTNWTTVSASLDQAPVSGRLYIALIQLHQGSDPGDDQDGFFNNLQVTIRPLINGSFQNYTGQSNEVSQLNSKIKAIREKDVFISDAPRIAMKGALLKQGAGNVIYTGDVSFGTLGQFEIAGNVSGNFAIGSTISVTGSANNNITGTVININYSIIGDLTTIYTDQVTVTELTVAVTITEATFVLAGLFYNAAKLTAGPGSAADLMLFGQIQAFDVWNQFNRVMRKFEATIDRTDSDTVLPDLLHKIILKDIDSNTTNGTTQYRIFILLHFEMNIALCEWGAFVHEVFNTAVAKSYETYAFIYITDQNA